jgi:hypothetical protein
MNPKNRKPSHPGEILQEEFLKPMGMSQVELARQMGVFWIPRLSQSSCKAGILRSDGMTLLFSDDF